MTNEQELQAHVAALAKLGRPRATATVNRIRWQRVQGTAESFGRELMAQAASVVEKVSYGSTLTVETSYYKVTLKPLKPKAE